MTITEARDAAKVIAKRIASGDVDPYAAAATIWKDILEKLDEPIPDDLWPFKSNASAIEDCVWDAEESGSNHDALVAQCRADIVRVASVLVGHHEERHAE